MTCAYFIKFVYPNWDISDVIVSAPVWCMDVIPIINIYIYISHLLINGYQSTLIFTPENKSIIS